MTITSEQLQAFEEAIGSNRLVANEVLTIGNRQIETELYCEVGTIEDLVLVVTMARMHKIPVHLLGNGFFAAEGEQIEGLVLKNNCRKFGILSMRGKIGGDASQVEHAFVTAETGVGMNQLVRFTLDEGLQGLESFLGESGTIGDVLAKNGKYEKEDDYLTSHLFTVHLLTKENEVVEMNADPMLRPYAVNVLEKKQIIPLSVIFSLVPGNKDELWKKGTQAAFEKNQDDLLDPLKGNFSI